MPSSYYQYVHPGENLLYFREKAETPDHIFYLGHHISDLKLRKSITQLVNKVYFTGGDINPDADIEEDLFKYYEDSASVTSLRPGLERLSDSRVILDSTAQVFSQSKIEEFKNARYRTSVTLTDDKYDIESIQLGQMVGFKNFGTFVDNLVLQIVWIDRKEHTVTLDLDTSLSSSAKRLDTLRRQIENEQVRNIPVAPM